MDLSPNSLWNLIWALLVIALVAGIYWHNFRPRTFRYRIMVELETPQGPRAGWAVREVRAERLHQLRWGSMAVALFQRGEAVAVDLPGGQTLYALLDSDPTRAWAAAFGVPWPQDLDDKTIAVIGANAGSPSEQSGLPRLVRFRDANDPRSMEVVNPADFAAAFGDGVTFRRVTIQMTDDPVTFGIERRLPDFGPAPGFTEWRRSLPDGDPRRHISREDFVLPS